MSKQGAFSSLTSDEVLEQLSSLRGAKFERAVKSFLYKKRNRPASREEQYKLMLALSEDARLNRFERCYSLVAACHKASELLKLEDIAPLLPGLWEHYQWATDLPVSSELRKDGTHLRFSILNVILNSSVLLQHDDRYKATKEIFLCLERINPRQTTHYAFNSTTNILNTVGVALLIDSDRLQEITPLLAALLYHAMRMKFTHGAVGAMLKINIPSRLSDVEPPSNFHKFEESFRKFLLIKTAAGKDLPYLDQSDFWAIANECVSQWTEAQKDAILEALGALRGEVVGPHPNAQSLAE